MTLILLFVCYINTHINYLTADGEHHHSLVVTASTSTVGLFVAVAITCSVAFLTNYSCIIIIIIINVGFYVSVLSLPNIVTNVRLSCLKYTHID